VGHLPPEKVCTIHGGIDLTRFTRLALETRQRKRRELGIAEKARLMTTVAVLRPNKGIQFMIDALPEILRALPDVRYLVVGSGPHEQSLKEHATNTGVAEHVIFTGMRSDVAEILGCSDVFVHPSLEDVLPTVLSEAMAARLPVIATQVGGIPEMVMADRSGLLVPPRDPGSLARSCIALLGDPARAARMGEIGRQIAETTFNICIQATRLREMYAQLLCIDDQEAHASDAASVLDTNRHSPGA
jgi:glycosyltransferase involved in cell wall biosynthesis